MINGKNRTTRFIPALKYGAFSGFSRKIYRFEMDDWSCEQCKKVLVELIQKAKNGELEPMPPSCEKEECEHWFNEGASYLSKLALEQMKFLD